MLVVETHVLAAAMRIFDMTSLDDTPSSTFFPEESVDLDSLGRHRILMLALREMTKQCFDLNVTYADQAVSQNPSETDGIRAYACEVISLGLLLIEFTDAIREGDGTRILRCWRYFLLLFKASDRTNYSIEAFTLLAQHKYLFSPRMAMQLQWSRTVNVHGRPGKNIPADLHMEHLNRTCKDAISGLGSNITDNSVQRVGRCLRRLEGVLRCYDKDNGIKEVSGRHSMRSTNIDRDKMLEQLLKTDVFSNRHGRAHRNFPKVTQNLIKKVSKDKLLQSMRNRMNKLILYN